MGKEREEREKKRESGVERKRGALEGGGERWRKERERKREKEREMRRGRERKSEREKEKEGGRRRERKGGREKEGRKGRQGEKERKSEKERETKRGVKEGRERERYLNVFVFVQDLESCDLDEDDLMLDVDFPEDQSLTSDGGSYMAEWRRRQLCWGTHNDTDSEFHTDRASEQQQSKRKDSQLSLDLGLIWSGQPEACPLGADVEELIDDCSAVRSQLEYLQKLLLLQ
ncbi:hypothetical protein WMY93_034406, partial [Mugilogobius chulae]